MRAAPHSEAGFTLVELLVGITLLAMLSLLLFSGMGFGTRAWERTTDSASNGNAIRSAQDTVAAAISSIYPFFVLASPTDRHTQFDGEDAQMTFFAPSRDHPGLDVVTIGREPDGDLVMNSRPELARNPQAYVTHRIILRGVKAISLAYFGAQSKDAPQQWYPTWHNAPRLPALIRVRATMDKPHTEWPDLVVAPRVLVDQGCVFDQLTKYCTGRP